MISDERLVDKMAEGDEAAFETLVRRYHAPIQIYAERMLRDRKRAEDVAQETFLRLIKQVQEGKPPAQIRPWLYKVAGNQCRDWFRRSSVKLEHTIDTIGDYVESSNIQQAASVLHLVEHQETRKELLQTLEELTDSQKEIVILRFYHDLKLEEIAVTTGYSLSAVKSHLYAGLKSLKKKLIRASYAEDEIRKQDVRKKRKEERSHVSK